MKIALVKLKVIYLLFSFVFTGLIISCCADINAGAENVIDSEGCLIGKFRDASAPKGLKVNLFIETSGSMAGFMDIKGTKFQRDIWSVVNGLDTKFKNLFNIFEVRSKSEPLNSLNVETFRKNLNTGGFVSSSSTDIPEMLDSILSKTNDKSVSILISDLIFSPEDGRQAQMMQITTDIKKRFSDRKRSSVLLQLSSEFYKKKGKVDDSPYYIWIIGPESGIKAVSEMLKTELKTVPNEVDFGLKHSIPAYSILPSESSVENATHLVCPRDNNVYAYTDFDNGDLDKITFWVGANLSQLPGYAKDQVYLRSNLDLDAGGAKVNLLEVASTSKAKYPDDHKLIKDSKLTHMFKIEISQLYENTVLKINEKKQRPAWIKDINLDTEDNQRKKTFGLEKMILGLEEAYLTVGEEKEIKYPLEILITKNKS